MSNSASHLTDDLRGPRDVDDSRGIGRDLHERRMGATRPGDVLTDTYGLIHSCRLAPDETGGQGRMRSLFSSLVDPRGDRWTILHRLKSLVAPARGGTARFSV